MSAELHAGEVGSVTLHRRVAANVRAVVAYLGLAQADVAAIIDVTQQAVSARLRGITPFTLNELDVLARRVGLDATDLVKGGVMPSLPPTGGGMGLLREDSNFQPAGIMPFLALAEAA